MSASLLDWTLAPASGLLTTEQCYMLLDVDIINSNDDLLKTLPPAATKLDGRLEFPLLDGDSASMYPPSPPDTKPSRAQLADDLLHQLDAQCKQENIFSNWLEEKVELPIFEHLSQERGEVSLAAHAAPAAPAAVPQPTEELLREFETVYGVVELTHLTPPQSPPGPATQLLLSYAQAQHLPQPQPQPQPLWDLERQLQDVDELVRHRAAQLTSPPPYAPSTTSSSAPSSPHSSTDEEWCAAPGPARPKPYARASDDRRSRKKEQNKNAATRYRLKKKAEVEVLLGEESSLRARHGELGNKCADLQREIRYLKGLMRDLFKAKGLIK